MAKRIAGCCLAFVVFIVICLILIFGIRYLFKYNCLTKDKIFDVVNNNYDTIIGDIQKGKFTKTDDIKAIEKVSYIDGVVEFYCGGKGIAPSSQDYGFYYTEDDLPKAVWRGVKYCDDSLLVEDGDGYSTDFQNNYYYTEKIRDNFYYYEAHF